MLNSVLDLKFETLTHLNGNGIIRIALTLLKQHLVNDHL